MTTLIDLVNVTDWLNATDWPGATTWLLANAAVAVLLDRPAMVLLIVVLVLLLMAWGMGNYLEKRPEADVNMALVKSFNRRVQAWLIMYLILGATFLAGSSRIPAVILFFGVSFWALREFMTLTPTTSADHRALFWVFFVFTPLQYLLVGFGHRDYELLGLVINPGRIFITWIPIFAFLFIPARIAFAGDHKRYLERTAKIQVGLIICVYALSHAPALLDLEYIAAEGKVWEGGNAGVLFFFIIVVQMSEVFQFVWTRLLGKRIIAPAINSNRTWEGLVGGMLTSTVLGTALFWVTPFNPIQAAAMALILSIMGFAGSMTMSAVKRDRGVEDYGTLVEGHVGVLDRFDSICFAAPIFYHVTRFFFTNAG